MSGAPGIEERVRRVLPQLSEVEVEGLTWTVQRLVEAFNPERVYVFGSQARGTPHRDSDIDLLIVMPRLDEPRHRLAQRALERIAPFRIPVELVFMSRAHFDERQPAIASLAATAAREGKVLYDAAVPAT